MPLLFLLFLLIGPSGFGQSRTAWITGQVVTESEDSIAGVSIQVLGRSIGVVSNERGRFSIQVPAERAIALQFSYVGYKTEQRNFLLQPNETEFVRIRLTTANKNDLQEVVIEDDRERRETGLIKPNPKSILNLPSAVTGVESLIKIFVGSNNELTSNYSVRGGSYDENLIYVNDFEIFRPYLIRSGQQEGLSFIHPEMVRNLNFYTGGFGARYGDKLSSLLDIQYRTPKAIRRNGQLARSAGSAYVSLLEQGLTLEGIGRNEKFAYLIGARNRSNRNLLSRQETTGNYVPSSRDLQGLLTYTFSSKWRTELLGNLSSTRFQLSPQSSQLTASVFSPLFSANLGVDIEFAGRENDEYRTNMIGLSLIHQPHRSLNMKWMISRFSNREAERIDVMGAYLFGERDFDKRNATYGLIINPLGAGVYHTWSRNELALSNTTLGHKGYWEKNAHRVQWGVQWEQSQIRDQLFEWEFQDSAGYALPYQPNLLQLNKLLNSRTRLDVMRLTGYAQDQLAWTGNKGTTTLQAGVRWNYNDLNQQFLLSPRVQSSYKPAGKKDIVYRLAIGAYHQPPFYRELRRYDGTVNTGLQAQRSWQTVAGMDYQFSGLAGRPMRLTTEAYFKKMWGVVPYDIDNVRIRYSGENQAKAYATGLEMRLHGELVPDAESWISLGIMKTREDLFNDHYYRYKNAAGEFINANSTDQVVIDSTRFDIGWVRRPNDRRITLGLFFQDYLSTNKNIQVFLNLLYGSNLPYNIPGSVRYRNAAVIDPYIRCDMGFSAIVWDEKTSVRRSQSPLRSFSQVRINLELFNVVDRANTISYLLIKDFSNTTYLLPNRLTPRLINLKMTARW
ncbi:MAG: TonB-dependent receptor [Bacteroidota bacterium]